MTDWVDVGVRRLPRVGSALNYICVRNGNAVMKRSPIKTPTHIQTPMPSRILFLHAFAFPTCLSYRRHSRISVKIVSICAWIIIAITCLTQRLLLLLVHWVWSRLPAAEMSLHAHPSLRLATLQMQCNHLSNPAGHARVSSSLQTNRLPLKAFHDLVYM